MKDVLERTHRGVPAVTAGCVTTSTCVVLRICPGRAVHGSLYMSIVSPLYVYIYLYSYIVAATMLYMFVVTLYILCFYIYILGFTTTRTQPFVAAN